MSQDPSNSDSIQKQAACHHLCSRIFQFSDAKLRELESQHGLGRRNFTGGLVTVPGNFNNDTIVGSYYKLLCEYGDDEAGDSIQVIIGTTDDFRAVVVISTTGSEPEQIVSGGDESILTEEVADMLKRHLEKMVKAL